MDGQNSRWMRSAARASDLMTSTLSPPTYDKLRHASHKPPRDRLRRDLRLMLGDGVFFSVMVGAGESFIPAYVLALGMGELLAGLVATVPLLAGAVLQLVAPWAVYRLGSARKWVVACAVTQALCLLALPVCAVWNGRSVWLVFGLATGYWAAGLATGPAWNSWVETLVPRAIRARFFAARTRLCQIGTLGGFLAGGALLHGMSAPVDVRVLFAALFCVAGISRLLSATCLAQQSEPAGSQVPRVRLRDGLAACPGRQLLAYLLAMQTAVWIAAPYFTPFMLVHLRLNYWQFAMLTAMAFAARILVLPILGASAKRYGAQWLLWVGGLCIIPLSSLWLLSDSILYLACVQVVSGMAWGAYELAMLLMFFETIPRRQRIQLLTLYNLGNSLAMVAGSLIGAAILHFGSEQRATYLTLFALSSAARLGTVVLLVRIPRVSLPIVRPAMRTLAVRPSAGAIEAPVVPSLPNGVEVQPRSADCDAASLTRVDERPAPRTADAVPATGKSA